MIQEKHEIQIRTVSPEVWINDENEPDSDTELPTKSPFSKKTVPVEMDKLSEFLNMESDVLYFSKHSQEFSELSLIPEERNRIARITAYKTVPRDKQFIVKWLYDLVDSIRIPEIVSDMESSTTSSTPTSLSTEIESDLVISRQYGQAKIESSDKRRRKSEDTEKVVSIYIPDVEEELDEILIGEGIIPEKHKVKKIKESLDIREEASLLPSTSKTPDHDSPETKIDFESETTDEDQTLDDKEAKEKLKKSNLKTIGVQTEKKTGKQLHVQISEKSFFIHETDEDNKESPEKKDDVDKETQAREKEKQD